jgi:hypothetical protein
MLTFRDLKRVGPHDYLFIYLLQIIWTCEEYQVLKVLH